MSINSIPISSVQNDRESLLSSYKISPYASEAVTALLDTIPPDELNTLQEEGYIDRILSYVPTEHFPSRSPRDLLSRSWDSGRDLQRRDWQNPFYADWINNAVIRTRGDAIGSPFSQNILNGQNENGEFSLIYQNPGLGLACRLTAVLARMNGSISTYPTDRTGRIVLNSVGGVDYASSILMIANGCPDNFTGPQSPNRILYFPVFQRSPNLQKYVAEITRYRSRHQLEQPLYSGFDRSLSETDPKKALLEMTIQEPSPINPPLAELQSILLKLRSNTEDPYDSQFEGEQGLVNLRAILRAMTVYEEVFQPRPVSNEN